MLPTKMFRTLVLHLITFEDYTSLLLGMRESDILLAFIIVLLIEIKFSSA